MNTIIALRIYIIFLTVLTLSCTPNSDSKFSADNFQLEDGESTQQMIERLSYREVSAEKDGFACGASFHGGLIFSPVSTYPNGEVGEFGIIFPDDRIVKLKLINNSYTDGRLVTKDFGTVVLRTNYTDKVFDMSISYLLTEEQINAIREKYGNIE